MKIKQLKLNLKRTMLDLLNRLRSGPNLFGFALCIAAAIVIISIGSNESISSLSNFEAGKVADRDIIAANALTFLDEEASIIKLETALKQVPAVFLLSSESSLHVMNSWDAYCESGEYASVKSYGEEALNSLLKQGIFSFKREDIISFNHEIVELHFFNETGSHRQPIPYGEIITMAEARETLGEIIRTMEAPVQFKTIAVDLLLPFVTENVFFSAEESRNRIEETKEATAPVILNIEKGKRIIRKGFIITETEMEELRALYLSFPKRDPRNIIGTALLVMLIYAMFKILNGRLIVGKKLNNSERYLLAALTGSYIIGTILLNNLSPVYEGFPVSLLVPTALVIMIIAVFMGTRTAMIMALALPLGAYYSGAFDNYSYIIALVSGAAASTVLHNAQNRMSLIKAGLQIAAANCFAVIVMLLVRQADLYAYPAMLFWAALNGVICGMLTIGFLPPLEHALNAVTPFRLQELSDLNAPILRKLFTAAPGTYSHSLMVANLAEQACQDIGANALLARVGAYYHDIGKMDNPEYFVENQTDHNKHDEIAPRLSATIIRSHVKLGIEKAHSLGLPKDVIAIIGEHHGNSLISWFYNKAMEQEELVNVEDFSYPGNPPRSRESAVVMLADITEAAVRTLSKPTAGKMDKFIHQLFEAKVEHGQLSESDLSFHDLEVIKNAFVKVLAGYYHSRIEYPNQKEEAG